MKRILFVDDEPNVLAGLQRMLRGMRHEWEMTFAESGPAALAALACQPFDVVVSDMRMPRMDGAELLTEVMRCYPHIVRIALSGQTTKGAVLRTFGVTHQFLAKPCDAETLKNAVARACALRELLAEDKLKRLISQMRSLPSLPALYHEIVEELRSSDASIRRVGEIISKDVGMTAKTLQLVNSAYFGLHRHVTDPGHAASLLGLEALKALVLSDLVFSQLERVEVRGLCLETLWNHSLVVGALAKRIAAADDADTTTRDHALMAGLLHDAGKLVLAAQFPDQYAQAIALARSNQASMVASGAPAGRRGRMHLCEAEQRVFHGTHAQVGAYLLGLWGLPDPLVEAVAFHHEPGRCPHRRFSPLTVVHVADALEHEEHSADEAFHSQLDQAYLTETRVLDRLPEWRDICAAVRKSGDRP